ncbi:MAG: hypothetical protein WC812_04220 [Candidatus Pacearchaeota archaeon]|jgi:hypothetical protein
MDKNLKKIAWENLNFDSTEKKRIIYVNPTKVGEVYPLTSLGSEKEYLGVFLGNHKIFKNQEKKIVFGVRDEKNNYYLKISNEGNMLWYGELDDGPFWPVGIQIDISFLASKKNKQGIEKRFKPIFDGIDLLEKNEN